MLYAIKRKSNNEILSLILNPTKIGYDQITNDTINIIGVNKNEADIIKFTNDPGWTQDSDYLDFNSEGFGYAIKQTALDWANNEIANGNYEVL